MHVKKSGRVEICSHEVFFPLHHHLPLISFCCI